MSCLVILTMMSVMIAASLPEDYFEQNDPWGRQAGAKCGCIENVYPDSHWKKPLQITSYSYSIETIFCLLSVRHIAFFVLEIMCLLFLFFNKAKDNKDQRLGIPESAWNNLPIIFFIFSETHCILCIGDHVSSVLHCWVCFEIHMLSEQEGIYLQIHQLDRLTEPPAFIPSIPSP